MTVRLPGPQDRTVYLGRTGSGKSVGALYLLSQQNFTNMPWVIIDYKGEDLIQEIRAQNKSIKTISCYDPPPKKPGLYWMQPTPKDDDDQVELWLRKTWQQGHVGLFIDEGYFFKQKSAFDIILTQGRSKFIPVIVLYQRPVYMSRFAVAQANFFAVYDQNDKRDLITTAQFLKEPVYNGREISLKQKLPKYYFIWYDVGEGKSDICKPVPNGDEIKRIFRERLNTKTGERGMFL